MGCGTSQSVGVVEAATIHGKSNEKNHELTSYQGKKKLLGIPLSAGQGRKDKAKLFGGLDSSSEDSGLGDTNYSKRTGSGETNSRPNGLKKDSNRPRSVEEASGTLKNFDMRTLPPLNFRKPNRSERTGQQQEPPSDLLSRTGLVQTAVVKKDTYAHFEIVEERMLNRNLSMLTLKSNSDSNSMYQVKPSGPPPRFLMQRERTKPVITADQIEEKLERANQRKMEQTQQKLRSLNSSISLENRADKYDYIRKDLAKQQGEDEGFKQEVQERQQRLREMRNKLKAKQDAEQKPKGMPTNPKEMEKELEKFRPKTPANFKPVYN